MKNDLCLIFFHASQTFRWNWNGAILTHVLPVLQKNGSIFPPNLLGIEWKFHAVNNNNNKANAQTLTHFFFLNAQFNFRLSNDLENGHGYKNWNDLNR